MKLPKRADLAKLGNQFFLVYQATPCIIMPIIPRLRDVPGHRTDVPIDPKELFCQRKPEGDLLIKLQDTQRVDPGKLTTIGKVSKASLQRIEVAIQRERQITADEQTRYQSQRSFR